MREYMVIAPLEFRELLSEACRLLQIHDFRTVYQATEEDFEIALVFRANIKTPLPDIPLSHLGDDYPAMVAGFFAGYP